MRKIYPLSDTLQNLAAQLGFVVGVFLSERYRIV